MAKSFEELLQGYVKQFTPPGGFLPKDVGIPKVGQIADQTKRGFESSFVRDLVQQNKAFDRAGLGRSVSKVMSPGTRSIQSNQALMDSLTRLYSQHGQIAASQHSDANRQYLSLLGQFAPMAYDEANKPGWFAELAGGVLGLGAQVGASFLPGGGIGMKELQKLLSGGGGQGGGGNASGYNPAATRAILNALSLNMGTR